ncbi:MAG TPA: YdcF family protein [Acetobacteraceae bacterium]|nr:YdcF family protein [Acetobacteraceae bacterium]
MTMNYTLSYLLIPPLGLAWLALLAVLASFRLRRKRSWGLGLAALALIGLLVLATPFVGTRLEASLDPGPPPPVSNAAPQAIVILSADDNDTVEGAEVGPLTLQRLLAGARLYRRTQLPVLVSGGFDSAVGATYATLMAHVLTGDFQVPVRWQEARSQTTWQNAEDSAAMLQPLGIRSVYLVTHSWHERRAMMAFRHFGMEVVAAPVPADAPGSSIVPDATGLERSFYALHEWIGVLDYAVRAWLSGPAPNSAAYTANIRS